MQQQQHGLNAQHNAHRHTSADTGVVYINHKIPLEVGKVLFDVMHVVDDHVMITFHLLQKFLISKSETSNRTNIECKLFGKTQSYLFQTLSIVVIVLFVN